ncbi:hypothetical protein F5Y17DRAFT_464025 [Xylariaceae sp. FL0594]|nr:hypothetical protein F5Y17DRAFT_464025 [Xylariaceae sp. FL0594]
MDLDATQRERKGNQNFKCFNCGKNGHYAKNCRSKRKFDRVPEGHEAAATTRQLAMTTKVITSEPGPSTAAQRAGEQRQAQKEYRQNIEGSDEKNPSKVQMWPEGEECPDGDPDCEYMKCSHNTKLEWLENFVAKAIRQGSCLPWTPEDEEARLQQAREITPKQFYEIPQRIQETIAYDIYQGRSQIISRGTDTAYAPEAIIRLIAQSYNHDGTLMWGDDPRIAPEHPQHQEISWVSCVTARCAEHLQPKLKEDWFPKRIASQPMDQPYEIKRVGRHLASVRTVRFEEQEHRFFRSLKKPRLSLPSLIRRNARSTPEAFGIPEPTQGKRGFVEIHDAFFQIPFDHKREDDEQILETSKELRHAMTNEDSKNE